MILDQHIWSSILSLYSVSPSGGYPKGGLKTLGNSTQIAYQRERSAVGADIEYRLDDNMLSYLNKQV